MQKKQEDSKGWDTSIDDDSIESQSMEDKNSVDDCNLHEEDIDSIPPVQNGLVRDDDVRLQEGMNGKDEVINEQQGINNIEMEEGNSDETTPSKPPRFEEKMKDGQETSEKMKGESNEVQKCSFSENSVSNPGDKETRSNETSLINDMSRFIKIGCALGHDMQGCQESLKNIINGIGEINGDPGDTTSKIDMLMVKQLWGNMSFDFATSSAMGLSGGIMSIWDLLVFSCHKISSYQNVLIVHGEWILDRFKSSDFGSSNGWYAFTRLSSDGKKMIKLDRFFISEGVSVVCPDLSANVLNNVVSDHRPILLKQEAMDYGPRVFRFFNSWLDEKDFVHAVKDGPSCRPRGAVALPRFGVDSVNILELKVSSWNGDDQTVQGGAAIKFKNKLKKLKENIKCCKRRYLAIKGIKREGTWVSDPSQVKEVFLNHFRGKFLRMENVTVSQRSTRFKYLSEEQSNMLIGPISMHELKDVVWSCDNDKAPGPNGFTFSLVKRYWELFKTDILQFVSEFFVWKLEGGLNSLHVCFTV
ncbi:hypothetical protein Tco_0385507 [Tanacetum coccineum]